MRTSYVSKILWYMITSCATDRLLKLLKKVKNACIYRVITLLCMNYLPKYCQLIIFCHIVWHFFKCKLFLLIQDWMNWQHFQLIQNFLSYRTMQRISKNQYTCTMYINTVSQDSMIGWEIFVRNVGWTAKLSHNIVQLTYGFIQTLLPYTYTMFIGMS